MIIINVDINPCNIIIAQQLIITIISLSIFLNIDVSVWCSIKRHRSPTL